MRNQAEKVLEKSKRTTGKNRIIYMDEDTWSSFRKACKGLPISRVLKTLMQDFIQLSKKK